MPILSAANWIRLTFPTPATVTAGQVFAIVVPSLPLSPDTDPAWGWGKASSDFYAGGVAFGGDSLGGWAPYVDGSDLAFVTFVDDGLPELPNTAIAGPLGYAGSLTILILLAAFGALRLLFVRRA